MENIIQFEDLEEIIDKYKTEKIKYQYMLEI